MNLNYPNFRLTNKQNLWLGFVLTGILLTNSINWSAYSRQSLGLYCVSALSWMFRHSKIDFNKLLLMSVRTIIQEYGLREGVLVVDDTDKERSKNARLIHGLGKCKDKSSGGYFKGQNIVFLVLVTEKVTIPVGFRFYQNDPKWLEWKKEDERLRKQKVRKKYRPKEVKRDYETYPTKQSLALEMVQVFQTFHEEFVPNFQVKAILADCFYGTKDWTLGLQGIYEGIQIISQLKSNQKIFVKGKELSLIDYFKERSLIQSQIVVRGGKTVKIYYSSVIAKVKAHGKKRCIIAYKYEGEKELRYVFATNMTWTVHKILQVYTLRWLVEVFIEDWKLYEVPIAIGRAVLTKHTGEDGANSSLTLSLLFDHSLLLHPKQKVLIKNNLSAATVGSLRNYARQEHWVNTFRYLIQSPNPSKMLTKWIKVIDEVFIIKSSSKHLVGKVSAW